jgi:hypothetical protein
VIGLVRSRADDRAGEGYAELALVSTDGAVETSLFEGTPAAVDPPGLTLPEEGLLRPRVAGPTGGGTEAAENGAAPTQSQGGVLGAIESLTGASPPPSGDGGTGTTESGDAPPADVPVEPTPRAAGAGGTGDGDSDRWALILGASLMVLLLVGTVRWRRLGS